MVRPAGRPRADPRPAAPAPPRRGHADVAAHGAPFGADTYDSVHSLLLNTSPAFVAAFNGSLAAALQRAVDEREAGREQHRPGFDYE